MPTAFNCSMCSAPLDLANASGATMRCTYCGNTMILPEELRGGVSQHAHDLTGIPFAPMVGQALKLAEVARLAQSGKKIAAIKLYREIFGVGLKEAKDAVERMETGQPVVFTETNYQTGNAAAQSFPSPELAGQVVKQTKRVGLWIAFIVLAFVVGIGWIISHAISTAFNSIPKDLPGVPRAKADSTSAPGFATPAFEFGSEGIGAGQFKDTRSIGIDGAGRIYVGEYTGGRVQVFDHDGKFITQWMVDPKKALLNLAVDRKGTVYVVHPSQILRYDGATGNLLGEVVKPASNRNEFYSDVFVALDGSLYAIGSNSNIIHLSPDGEVKGIIKVAEKVGEDVSFDKVAVDGSGNIYALEDHAESIFKFAPDGKFINRFGGKGKGAGQLSSPHNVAVDGQGRVYVSDLGRGVQVFDGSGRYLDSFGGHEVVFGLAINDQNEIFATERNRYKIVKYTLSK
ncbi:MAG: tripartite motif-containing protein 71 [Acidobacteriota bacterium]|nr:tripartite motif-containing protein 71 [Acidobacteriota bacterium]